MPRPAAEDYVRPALLAVEPADPRRERWAFRLVLALLVLLAVAGVALGVRALVHSGSDDPGVTHPSGAARPLGSRLDP